MTKKKSESQEWKRWKRRELQEEKEGEEREEWLQRLARVGHKKKRKLSRYKIEDAIELEGPIKCEGRTQGKVEFEPVFAKLK